MSCKYLWAQTLKHEYVPTRFPFTNVESLASFQRRFRHAKPLVAILISCTLGQPIDSQWARYCLSLLLICFKHFGY